MFWKLEFSFLLRVRHDDQSVWIEWEKWYFLSLGMTYETFPVARRLFSFQVEIFSNIILGIFKNNRLTKLFLTHLNMNLSTNEFHNNLKNTKSILKWQVLCNIL